MVWAVSVNSKLTEVPYNRTRSRHCEGCFKHHKPGDEFRVSVSIPSRERMRNLGLFGAPFLPCEGILEYALQGEAG